MAFWLTDLDSFFGDFAIDAVLARQSGTVSVCRVIFDNNYLTLLGTVDFAGVASSEPGAVCKSSDVAGARHGDTLTVNGATYAVIGVEPDGSGITILRLSRLNGIA